MAPALDGIRVLDFSTLLPGPLATRMLSACGADVIKIEPPGGDGMRSIGLGAEADEAVYAMLNAGKRVSRIDLKAPEERDRIIELAAGADVLVEQFRPGVMERLGLGFETLRAQNPRLIYCSITGYGQKGPLAQQAGHDLTYLAKTGILSLSPGSPEGPCVPPVLAADIAGGSYPAVMNILLALMSRDKGGEGMHLDIAMADGLFPFAFWALAQGRAGQAWPRAGEQLLNGGSPRYRLYPARDGVLVAVAAIEEKFWQKFCDMIDLPERFRSGDVEAAPVIASVAERIAGQDAAHWRECLDGADCCCAIVDTLQAALDCPHFAGRDVLSALTRPNGDQARPELPMPLARTFLCDEPPIAGPAAEPRIVSQDMSLDWRSRP